MGREPLSDLGNCCRMDDNVPCQSSPSKSPAHRVALDDRCQAAGPAARGLFEEHSLKDMHAVEYTEPQSPGSSLSSGCSFASSHADGKFAAVTACLAKLRAANQENAKLQLRLAHAQVNARPSSLFESNTGKSFACCVLAIDETATTHTERCRRSGRKPSRRQPRKRRSS